jgi:hypothetical protein
MNARLWIALPLGLACAAFGACDRPRASAPASTAASASPRPSADDGWITAPSPDAPPPPAPPPVESASAGRDFAEELRILYRVAACGNDDPVPSTLDAAHVKAHCDEVRPRIEAYRARYVAVAKPFLTALHPAALPDKVVYPFGGGDVVTALTTYPQAKEITTLSLELVGDPRRIRGMSSAALERSLRRLREELNELYYFDDYSRSETLKKTQRGDIPGELGLFLAGLYIHGFEPVSLRYFTVNADGSLHYLTAAEIAEIDTTLAQNRKATWTPPDFSEAFANAEITFRPVGGGDLRVHRHIAQNLANDPLEKTPGVLRHLAKKGKVAAMTKAASYLLWQDGFSSVRGYLVENMAFMISDSTGMPPSLLTRAGFVQETYGKYSGSLLKANLGVDREYRALWKGQPERKLPFRYGYASGKEHHLVVTKRPDAPAPNAGAPNAGAPNAGAPDAGAPAGDRPDAGHP